jgi:hypothetical protein
MLVGGIFCDLEKALGIALLYCLDSVGSLTPHNPTGLHCLLRDSFTLLSRQCGILNISQPYRPPLPVTGIALLYCLDNVGSLTSHNPIGLHCLLRDSFTLLSRQCGILYMSQPYRPPRPVKRTVLLCLLKLHSSDRVMPLGHTRFVILPSDIV